MSGGYACHLQRCVERRFGEVKIRGRAGIFADISVSVSYAGGTAFLFIEIASQFQYTIFSSHCQGGRGHFYFALTEAGDKRP